MVPLGSEYFLDTSAVHILSAKFNLVCTFCLENINCVYDVLLGDLKHMVFANDPEGHFGPQLIRFF